MGYIFLYITPMHQVCIIFRIKVTIPKKTSFEFRMRCRYNFRKRFLCDIGIKDLPVLVKVIRLYYGSAVSQNSKCIYEICTKLRIL